MLKKQPLSKASEYLLAIAPKISSRTCSSIWGEPRLPKKLLEKK